MCCAPILFLLTQALNHIHGFKSHRLLKPHDKYFYCHSTHVCNYRQSTSLWSDGSIQNMQFLLKRLSLGCRKVGLISRSAQMHFVYILTYLAYYAITTIRFCSQKCHLLAIRYVCLHPAKETIYIATPDYRWMYHVSMVLNICLVLLLSNRCTSHLHSLDLQFICIKHVL